MLAWANSWIWSWLERRSKQGDSPDYEYLRNWSEEEIERKENNPLPVKGNLSFRSSQSVKTYLEQLKGRKHLIIGNHDFKWQKNIQNMNDYFETVSNLEVIKLDKKLITLRS